MLCAMAGRSEARKPEEQPLVRELLAFIDASPTPYHAVEQCKQRLETVGFHRVEESDVWSLSPGSRFYVVRGGSSIAAFIVGEQPPHKGGFQLIGAHTDSPCLRIKPKPDVRKHGYLQVAVEPYGGVLYSTWLDRDLSIAGRVVIDDGTPTGHTRLLRIDRPLLRIPNLAIHLERTVNSEGLKLNAQNHLVPVLGLDRDGAPEEMVLETLARELDCTARAIVGFDLCLFDTQPAAIAGAAGELIFAPRLDNLASCFGGLRALCEAQPPAKATRGIVLYDHEEVGSQSAQGADSTFLRDALERICLACSPGEPSALSRALARSLLVSADMAHGVHPNYADKHEPTHRPVLGQGPVIKVNAGQSYATDGETLARFTLLCRSVEVAPQSFVTRSDLACGSTIGPITAGVVGLRAVDVGSPMLSMHSIREMAACADISSMQKVLDKLFAG
jgi:aspartyl aminopeptidase